MEKQFNNVRKTVQENERSSKETENKKEQILELNNSTETFNSSLEQEITSELEDRSFEIVQLEKQKEIRMKRYAEIYGPFKTLVRESRYTLQISQKRSRGK